MTNEPKSPVGTTATMLQSAKAAQLSAAQTTEQIRGSMDDYFSWLQRTVSASLWSESDLTKKLMKYTEQNIVASQEFVQRLSRAKDVQELAWIQAEFVQTQLSLFAQQANSLGEAYNKAATEMIKWMPFHISR